MLMVQDHGNGYLGLCSDEGLPDSDVPKVWMSIDDLGRGVRDALDKTGGTIDVISLDACTLGTVEIAYELRGTASYLVASELGVPFDGQNYIELLSGLSTSHANLLTIMRLGTPHPCTPCRPSIRTCRTSPRCR
jgi:hypothetical protein